MYQGGIVDNNYYYMYNNLLHTHYMLSGYYIRHNLLDRIHIYKDQDLEQFLYRDIVHLRKLGKFLDIEDNGRIHHMYHHVQG